MGQIEPSSWRDLLREEMTSLGETLAALKILIEVGAKLDDAGHGAQFRWTVRVRALRLYARLLATMAVHYKIGTGIFCLAARDVGTIEATRRMEACTRVWSTVTALLIWEGFALSRAAADWCRQELDEGLARVCAGGDMAERGRVLWLMLAPTSTLSSPLQKHRKRERAEQDPAAVFEGAHDPEAELVLRRELRKRYAAIKQAGNVDRVLDLMRAVLGAGLQVLRRSIRHAVRAAYAADAPLEGLVRVKGTPLTREVRIDPRSDQVIDIDDYLPAGGEFAEDLSPESLYVKREEREDLERKVRRAEAAFCAELDSLGLSSRNREVLVDYFLRAPRLGYGPASKEGRSMRQFWGSDYDGRRRMLERVREHHADFFAKWRCLQAREREA